MGWYRYWQKWTSGRTETYRHHEGEYDDEQFIEEDCERWAQNTHCGQRGDVWYTKGFEAVDLPPFEWLQKKLADALNSITYYTERAAFLREELEKAGEAEEAP
jgi:hypothetical protein